MQILADPTIRTVLYLAAGILFGGLIGWFITRYRTDRIHTAAMTEKRVQIAGLEESLQSKSEEIEKAQTDLETSAHELKTIHRSLLETSQAKAAAESRLERLGELEKTVARREEEIDALKTTITSLKTDQATLETILEKERRSTEEKITLLEDLRAGLTDTYKSLAAGIMRENSRAFLDLAGETFSKYMESAKKDIETQRSVLGGVIKPIEKALNHYDQQVQAMERSRESAYGGLTRQVDALLKTQDDLQKETGRLARAMRVPHVRGRWGELTLKRTVELAGMSEHCDFTEQATVPTAGSYLRPDMVVRLPDGRRIVIDAKVPLSAYLDSLEADSEEKTEQFLDTHAKQVQSHIHQLAQKSYWSQFEQAPEFVVLFIPGENFFSAALARNPGLIELGAARRVIPATPTTLISLLRTVAMGWHQTRATENARSIGKLGKELYERLSSMLEHVNRVGKSLDRCTTDYNRLVGSLTRRVIVSARKFEELGITSKNNQHLPDTSMLETTPRKLDMDTE